MKTKMNTFARMLFVWAKKGEIKCFSPDEIRDRESVMIARGWTHTATIDPARWIESMANGNTDPSDMLDELQMGPNIDRSQPTKEERAAAGAGCVTHHFGCDCREAAVTGLLREVMDWHADHDSADYNECDVLPCAWCDKAAAFMGQTAPHQATASE